MRKVWRYLGSLIMSLLLFCIWIPKQEVQAAGESVSALIVTRGDYDSPGYSDLSPAPQNDGENMKRVLQNAYLAPHITIKDKADVTTIAGMTAVIQETFKESKDCDINYFYYSGHGNAGGLYLYSGQTMSATQLANAFDGILGTNILIIDSCNSGALVGKGARSIMLSDEMFLESFMTEFKTAVESPSGRSSRSALANSRFKVLMAASSEELSWQWDRGMFTSALTYGCGIDAFEDVNYILDCASADLNRNGSISLDEITTYIQNTNRMSHVRVYPQSDFGEFMPVAEEKIPSTAFTKVEVGEQNASVRINYTASSESEIQYVIYHGDYDGLSLLTLDIGGGAFDMFTYTFEEDGCKRQPESTKTTTSLAGGEGKHTIVLPESVRSKSGDYTIALLVKDKGVKYMLPFHIQAEETTLLEGYDLKVGVDADAVYLPSDQELEVTADFGTTTQESLEKPRISCYVLDKDRQVVRTLGENEWMEIVATKFVNVPWGANLENVTAVFAEGNCYKKFYWNGKDDTGKIVPAGEYTIKVVSTGAVNDVKTKRIIAGDVLGNVFLSADKTFSYEAFLDGRITAKVMKRMPGEDLLVKVLQRGAIEKGIQSIKWDGTDAKGETAADGIYYICLSFITDSEAHSMNIESGDFAFSAKKEETSKEETETSVTVINPSAVLAKAGRKTVTKLTLGVKEKVQLSATVLPINATDKTVTYKSSNKKVVSVSAGGKITAKKKGKAKITITTKNAKKAVINVRVKKAPKKVTIQAVKKILKKGKSYKLKAKVSAGAASYKMTYRSSNQKIVTVDGKGKVKAVKRGKATVTVKTYNGKKAKIKIIVK